MEYIKTIETEAIIPPVLPPNVKFDNTSAMIQLLKLKGVFSGAEIDEMNMHLENFIRICTSYTSH